MKRSVVTVLLLTLIACIALTGVVPANARSRHQLRHKNRAYIYWTLPATANEGQPVSFIWRGKYFGGHYKVVVERPFGTSHVWKGIMQLNASGNGTLPGMRLGVYWFRIAVFRGRTLLAQQTSVIKVFGTVPFTTLLQYDNTRVYTMTGNSFSYVLERTIFDGDSENVFGVSNNNCSSVHVAFAVGSVQTVSNVTGTVTVVQESRDPVSSSAPFERTGSVDAELTPGQTWGVNASAQGGSGEFYVNGYATCDSTEPFHQ